MLAPNPALSADAAVDPTITTAIAAANERMRPKLKIFADIVSLLLIEFGGVSASRVPDRGAGLLGRQSAAGLNHGAKA